ncbi:hypothetical protein [Streptomyces sp. UNOC14_S4]|uniref:hypothetical protein n=1 Tax=Streptomyces sp. UNOC14_S4 TaxID=2872340 RepID=UPI001E621041|nr:hypothetical protein [Streptomyces sp. UNOC14_S4]MCC3768767.1 hypothetical protein [Streptomyces sp. UNOC14_S4]
MTDQQENSTAGEPVNWTDPNKSHIVEHFRNEVEQTIKSGRRGCRNCGGLGVIVMVVEGEPKSYACSCGG